MLLRLRVGWQWRPGGLRQNLANRIGSAVGERNRPADVRHVLVGVVDAEGFEDRGEEIGRPDGARFLNGGAVFAGASEDRPAADAAATDHGRPGVRIVIAALALIDTRRTA